MTKSAPANSEDTELKAAIDKAVRRSGAAFAKLRGHADQLLERLGADKQGAGHAHSSDPDVQGLLATERALNKKITDDLRSVFDRQAATIGNFNIVVFGRTGVGKSSLIQAMTRGEGKTISAGKSDNTVVADPVRWSSCLLTDLPGIAGPSEERAALEAVAHEAVQTADVVLLCFDSQNQQKEEFAQVAAWVRDYGKPLVVVFNVRNRAWLNPVLAGKPGHRAKLTADVANQAGRIREWLAGLGLPGTVIVAIHTQRAVFARCDPYSGPQQTDRASKLAEYGAEKLLAWSHYPVLDRLLRTAIGHDAIRLRLGMLSNQAVGTLRKAEDGLQSTLRVPAAEYAKPVEAGIEPLLQELGRPAGGGRAGLRAAIERLEAARGQDFDASAAGRIRVFARARIRAALAPLREQTRQKAAHAVEEAAARRKFVGAKQFLDQAYDKKADRDAVEKTSEAIARHVETALADSAAAMTFALAEIEPEGTDVLGRTGVGKKRLGYFSGGTATLGTAATPTVTAAIALVSLTPLAVLAVGAAVLAGFLGLGSKAREIRKNAELARQRAVAAARGQAEKGVSKYYDRIERDLMAEVDAMIAVQLAGKVGRLVPKAQELRDIEARAATKLVHLRQLLTVLERQQADPTAVFAAAAASCVPGDHPLGADAYWLGAEWCDDPEGLEEPAPAAGHPQDGAAADDDVLSWARSAASRSGLTSLLSLLRRPRKGSGTQWLVQAHAALDGDGAAAGVLAELDGLADDPRPRITVLGDYNAGKTSLLRRLFAEAGLRVPDSLTVNAVPETAEVQTYPCADVLLLDTPGLHSGIPEHDAKALEAVADAAVVVYVLAPTRSQESEHFTQVLYGDPSLALPGKLDRTLFLINRSDEMGVDPEHDPEGYRLLAAAKARELLEILSRLGRPPKPEQVKVVATAPDAVEVSTRDDVRRYHGWDGVEDAVASLASLIRIAAPTALDVALLHGALARLGALAARTENEKGKLDASVLRQQDVVRGTEDGADAGRALIAAQRRRLHEAAFTVVDSILGTLARSADPDARHAATERLAKWWEEPEVEAALLDWGARCRADVEEWRQTVLPREREPRSFRKRSRARAEADVDGIDVDGLRADLNRERTELGMTAAHSIRAALVMAEFEIGFLLGPVLAVVDTVRMVKEHQTDKRRAVEVAKARGRFFEVCGKWAQAVVGDEKHPGELEPVRLACVRLERMADCQREPLVALQRERAAVVRRLETYQGLIAKAAKQL
jgi:predicted GTPase